MHLREYALAVPAGRPANVDRDSGVIKDVKILGLTSPNSHGVSGAKSTRYKREALEAACALYEGADVFLNHRKREPGKPPQDDDAGEKLGVLRNVRYTPEGLRGDFHYLKAITFNEGIAEDAERGLGVYSFSHDANGEGETDPAGVFTIERITEVRRVDIVARGATNRTLFESREPSMKKTVRQVFESAWLSPNLSRPRKAWLARVLEADYMDEKKLQEDGPEPLGALAMPADASDAADPMDAAFETALIALAKSVIAKTVDGATAVSQFKELIKTHAKITGEAEPEAPVAEMADEAVDDTKKVAAKESDDEKKEEEKKVAESLQRAESELSVYRLCEQKKFTPTENQRIALVHMPEGKRMAFILEAVAATNRPRSTSPHQLVEAASAVTNPDVKFPTSAEGRRRLVALS